MQIIKEKLFMWSPICDIVELETNKEETTNKL